MYTSMTLYRMRLILRLALGAGLLFATNWAAAGDQNVAVVLHVSGIGLDLTQPADAGILYARVKKAARVACTHGNRADLVPVDDPRECYEAALADAIHSANSPALVQIYLTTHTPREAALHGIGVPAQVASVPRR